LKPQNILLALDDTSKVKLVDFGSGSVVDGKQDKLTGTPLYMSPEQMALMQEFQRTGVLPSTDFDAYVSDVYSLGMTFLHVALMEPPIKVLTSDRFAALTEYLGILSVQYPTVSGYLGCMVADNKAQRWSFDDIYANLIQNFPQLRHDQSGNGYQASDQRQTVAVEAPDPYLATPYGEAAQLGSYNPLANSQGSLADEQCQGFTPSGEGVPQGGYDQLADRQESCAGEQSQGLAGSSDPNQQVYPPQISYPEGVAQCQFAFFDDSLVERTSFRENPFVNTRLEGMEQRHIQEKQQWLFRYSTTERDISEKVKYLILYQVANCFEAQIFYRCQGCNQEMEISDSQQPICEAHWLLCEGCLNVHDNHCPNRLPGTLPE
jgi:serine/threonine protein kinase